MIRVGTVRTGWLRGLMASLAVAAGATAASAQSAPLTPPQAARVRIGSPVDDSDRVTLTGNRHPRVALATDLGRADDGLRLERMILSLNPDPTRAAALDRAMAATHDPASPDFGRRLSVQEFEREHGVAFADIAAITAWLVGHGFTIDEVPAGRRSIVFSGTVAQLRAAFHVEMHRYDDNGQRHLANVNDPEIPDALSGVVGGIVSLHDFRSRPLHVRRAAGPDYTNGSSHAMAPADFATIYNLKPLYAQSIDGSGASIAVLGRTTVVAGDLQQFRTTMNLPANPPQIIVNGASPGRQSGDEGESDLDLEWAGAVAPAASIRFVTSASTASTDGIDLSAQYAVSNNVADIVSLSYGLCEADLGTAALNFYNGLWQQAAAQGMTVLVSSGDSGAAGCDAGTAATATRGRAVNGLCTSPYSTCVGGTQFADTANPSAYWSATSSALDQSSALAYIPEVVWNESGSVAGGSGLWSSGGGASTVYAKPAWQTAVGVPADGKRDVPDVSLSAASHDGYLVFSSDNATSTRTLYVFGGTSASAPSFAGLVALVRQKTGYRQGSINPRLYQLSAAQASAGPAVFHTITSGNNSVPGVVGYAASPATPAYNLASGLGSVDAAAIVNHWTDVLPATTTALAVAPNAVTVGQGVTLTATVAGSVPTGAVQFKDGAANLGSAVTLNGGSAALTTVALAVGNHTITALYAGDASNQPSVSPGVAVSIAPVVTAVQLATSAPSVVAGQSVTFTATLTARSPGGTVQFLDGATVLASVPVTACSVTYTTATLAAGAHPITAAYSGDANNAPSASTVVTETVTPAVVASSTALSASATVYAVDQSVTFAATVAGQSPSGTVQFKDGAVVIGAPVALDAGTATFVTGTLAVGVHGVTAVYGGDAANAPSTSVPLFVTVTKATPSLTLTSTPLSPVTSGQSLVLTVVITGASPGGTVQFRDGGSVLATVSVSAGSASFATSALSVGTHTLDAVYAGDASNNAAVSGPLSVAVVAAGPVTVTVPALPGWAALLMAALLFVLGAWRSGLAPPFAARSRRVTRLRRAVGARGALSCLLGLVAAAALWPASSAAAPSVVAGWDLHALPGGANAFGTSPFAATTSDPNAVVGGLTRGTGVATSGTAAARGWGGTDWIAASASAAATADDTVSFTVTAKPGYQVSLTSIDRLDYRRSSSGPPSGVLQYRIDSGPFADVATVTYPSTASAGSSVGPFDLSGIAALQGVAAGHVITLRIVNFGGSGAGGTWYLFDTLNTTAADLEVTGNVGSVASAGACGTANGQTFASAPAANLCSAGVPGVVLGAGPWSWNCVGSASTANCSANTSVIGNCP